MDSFNTNNFDYNLLSINDNDAQNNKLIFEPTITYASNENTMSNSNTTFFNSHNPFAIDTVASGLQQTQSQQTQSNSIAFNDDIFSNKLVFNNHSNWSYHTNSTSTVSSSNVSNDQHKLTQNNDNTYNFNYNDVWAQQNKPIKTYSNYLNYPQTNNIQSSDLQSLSASTTSFSSSSSSSSSTSSPNIKEFSDLNQLKSDPFNSIKSNQKHLTTNQSTNSKEIKLEHHVDLYSNYTKTETSTANSTSINISTNQIKRKMSDTDTDVKFIYAVECDACDKVFNNNNNNNEISEPCKCNFRHSSRRLINNINRPICNQNCYLKKDKNLICSTCKFLSVGLTLQNDYQSSSTVENKKSKQELDDDLNLNQNSFNEMRNLSIEILSSSSSSGSLNSSPAFSDYYFDFFKLLLKEIDLKKNQIRSEHNEQRIKFYLSEMSAKISSCLANSLKLNESFIQMISQKAKVLFNNSESSNKQLLIAYECLIDDTLKFNSNSFDLRIKNLLNNIYSKLIFKKSFKNEKTKLSYDNSTLAAHSYDQKQTHNQSLITLRELKLFHFLLLLFSSFQSLDDFIRLDNSNDTTTNIFNCDLNFCQKSIISLIDRLCDDKFTKTQILLTVSEIDFF